MTPCYRRFISSTDTYMIYVDEGRDKVTTIFTWYWNVLLVGMTSYPSIMNVLDCYASSYPILYIYVIIVLYIIYDECYLYDETVFLV